MALTILKQSLLSFKVQMTKIYIPVSSLQFKGIVSMIIMQKTAYKNSN